MGDTRIKALAAANCRSGAVALVTVTAPGKDVLPWDRTGRVVQKEAAREWNECAPAKWRELNARAAKVARKIAAWHSGRWFLLMRSWEYQKRGVLHLHLVLPYGTRGERAAATAYVAELAALAKPYGFGFVDRGKLSTRKGRTSSRVLTPVKPGRALAYCAAYLASSGAGKEGIAEVARTQGVPGPIVYVAPALSRLSGVTMRSLRLRRRVVMRHPDAPLSPSGWRAACLADAVEQAGAPLARNARLALAKRALAEGWTHCAVLPEGEVIRPTDAAPPSMQKYVPEAEPGRRVVGAVRLDLAPHGVPDGGSWAFMEWVERGSRRA